MRALRTGASGDDVAAWQHFLIGQGYLHDEADGAFGPNTAAATALFQQACGLGADGVVGNMTYAAAMSRGLEAVHDSDDQGRDGPNWPSPPVGLSPLSGSDRERLFGRFAYVAAPQPGNPEAIRITDGWAAASLQSVRIPQLDGVLGAPTGGSVTFHKRGVRRIAALFQAWEDAGLLPRVVSWAGSWAPRFVRGSRTYLSNHAWGTAFDINAGYNPLGATPALLGRAGCVRELVELANQNGFYWGGHFSGRPDGMHFELAEAD